MLTVKNLEATVADKPVLNGIDLDIGAGEIHAIMGPNGSGKSSLSHVLSGNENYEVVKGNIEFGGEDLLEMEVDERAKAGLFMSFQYPVEIPGVNSTQFLRSSLNAVRSARGEEEISAVDFLKLMREKAKLLAMDESLLKRAVNSGFSGGEKKRFEILQMMVLEPKLVILDETDSGLDIDALKDVSRGVNAMRDAGRSFIIITHYQRLLDHIEPDHVHVLSKGRIVKSGGKEIVHTLEKEGYAGLGIAEKEGSAA